MVIRVRSGAQYLRRPPGESRVVEPQSQRAAGQRTRQQLTRDIVDLLPVGRRAEREDRRQVRSASEGSGVTAEGHTTIGTSQGS